MPTQLIMKKMMCSKSKEGWETEKRKKNHESILDNNSISEDTQRINLFQNSRARFNVKSKGLMNTATF
jgi:hypothetical protein